VSAVRAAVGLQRQESVVRDLPVLLYEGEGAKRREGESGGGCLKHDTRGLVGRYRVVRAGFRRNVLGSGDGGVMVEGENMRENISAFNGNVTNAVGRMTTERDEATLRMNSEADKGDFVMRMKYRGKRDGLQRAIDLLVEEGVIAP
jgi:hypothetical protein